MSSPMTRSARKRRRQERERPLIENHIAKCNHCLTENCTDRLEAVSVCSDYHFGLPPMPPERATWMRRGLE